LKMELIECSETSAYCNFNQTPGKYPKEYIHLKDTYYFIPNILQHVSVVTDLHQENYNFYRSEVYKKHTVYNFSDVVYGIHVSCTI